MARGRKLSAGRLSDQKGASAVEFALVMPVFLLLVLGALAYGIYFGAAHSVQQLAADAARVSVAGINRDERCALIEEFIDRNASTYVLIDRDRLDFSAAPSPADPGQFIVEVSYDASALPVWNIYPPIPMPGRTIRYASTIRNGGHGHDAGTPDPCRP